MSLENLEPTPPPEAPPSLSDRDRAILFLSELQERTPRAIATWVLIAANVAVFAAMAISGVSLFEPTSGDILRWGADYGPYTTGGQWWRAFTAMFVHIGVFHIAMNMFVLYRVGPFIERLVGHAGMLVVYLGSGLLGSIASLAFRPDNISAGASGAVFGLFGVLLGFLARRRRSIPNLVVKSLGQSALLFVGLNLLIGFSIPYIDNSAHLGGLAGGCVLGFVIALPVSPDGFQKRRRAALSTGLIATALVVGLAALLPRTGDLQAQLEAIAKVDSTTNALYGDALDRRQRGTISDEALAQRIETDVIPRWREAQKQFAKLGRVSARKQKFVDLLRRYVSAKLQFYELTARSLRDNDQAVAQDARARAAEAASLLQQIERSADR